MTKLERDYIALLRLYRHRYGTPVNDLINTAVAEYLAKLYNIDQYRIPNCANSIEAQRFLPPR